MGCRFLLGREGGFGPGDTDESRVPQFRAEFEDLLKQVRAVVRFRGFVALPCFAQPITCSKVEAKALYGWC